MLPNTSPLISYIPLGPERNISFQLKPMFVQQTVLEARDNIFFWRDLKTSQDSKDVLFILSPAPPPTREICLNSKVMSHLSFQRGRQVDVSTAHKSFMSPSLGFLSYAASLHAQISIWHLLHCLSGTRTWEKDTRCCPGYMRMINYLCLWPTKSLMSSAVYVHKIMACWLVSLQLG